MTVVDRLRGMRRDVLLVLVALLVLVLLSAGFSVWRESRRTPLDRALDVVPAGSLRIGFTDWAAVRERLKPTGLSRPAGVQRFLDAAYDADLSAASSIDDSGEALAANYGFSPANARWEAFAQSRDGAVMVLRLDDDVDLDTVAKKLSGLGYPEPSADDGVWAGGTDLVSGIDSSITPELAYVVLDRSRHLVIASDTRAYAALSEKVAAGDVPSLGGTGLADLAGKVPVAAGAFLWRGGFACEDLAMSQADDGDQARAKQLVSQAGGVDPLDGLVISQGADRTLQATLGFADSRQAEDNLRSRAKLYVGPAAGRSGSYADDVRLTRSRTSGDAVLLSLKAREKTGPALSTLSSGPVLFATC